MPIEGRLILTLLGMGYALFSLFIVANLTIRMIEMRQFRLARSDRRVFDGKVSVVIPMRDEELNAERCVRSLLSQDYPGHLLEVIVVDDASTDRTPEILDKLKKEFPSLGVFRAPPLPAGWVGKSHACHYGASHATGTLLAFLDSDTFVSPDLIRAASNAHVEQGLDMISIVPRQLMVSLGEKVLLPGLFFATALRMKFAQINDPLSREAIANGQFLIFNRESYLKMGGHAAIRTEVQDDIALARLCKGKGFVYKILFGEDLVSTRMYTGTRTIFRGFVRNMFDIMELRSWTESFGMFLRSFLLGPVMVLFLAAAFLVPESALWLALGPAVLALAWFGALVSYYQLNPLFLVTFPLGLLAHGVLILSSFQNRSNGKREWKGRYY